MIRELVTTEYVLMFEDDWECTRNFKVSDLIETMKRLDLSYFVFVNLVRGRVIGDHQGLNVSRTYFDYRKLDVHCPPIYKNWLDSKKYLRKLLESIPIEHDDVTCHWPCYGLQPSLVLSDMLKKYPFDETETSSFMELSYGIDHVVDGNTNRFGGVGLGIPHIGDISSYVLNDQHRWWDPK